MEVTCSFLLNPKSYQNETWSNTSVLSDKYFQHVFDSMLDGDWKLVPGPFMISSKWQYSEIWSFLIVDIYHF